MNKIEKLKINFANFFLSSADFSNYSDPQIDELLNKIDFEAFFQSICLEYRIVYAYKTLCDNPSVLKYRSRELFEGRATRILQDVGFFDLQPEGMPNTVQHLELWVKEDMSIAVVSCVYNVFNKDYCTEFRTVKGDEWPHSEINLDLADLVEEIQMLCDRHKSAERYIYFEP